MAQTPHIAVIGGGSTGIGIARDLAMWVSMSRWSSRVT